MKPARQPTAAERDAIRLRFYREYRGEGGCSSAGIHEDPKGGGLYLSVGTIGQGERLPTEYAGLPVGAYEAGRAVHAIYTASASS